MAWDVVADGERAMMALPTDLGLGIRTDLMLLRSSATISVHPDCVAVVSPGNPDFYFGNFLVPRREPTADTVSALRSRFAELIGRHPGIGHECFAWSSAAPDEAALETWRRVGFRVDRSIVLACDPGRLRSPRRPLPDLVVRTATRSDVPSLWRLYARFEREQNGGSLPAAQRRFLRARVLDFVRMIQAGAGDWHVAVVDGQPAAALGLIVEGPMGRFQEVLTDSRFRNRGLCTALVHRAAADAFARGTKQLVMIADASYHALRLYRSLGFRDAEGLITACRAP